MGLEHRTQGERERAGDVLKLATSAPLASLSIAPGYPVTDDFLDRLTTCVPSTKIVRSKPGQTGVAHSPCRCAPKQ